MTEQIKKLIERRAEELATANSCEFRSFGNYAYADNYKEVFTAGATDETILKAVRLQERIQIYKELCRNFLAEQSQRELEELLK